MNQSYFIQKLVIKDKIKKLFQKIEHYEKSIDKIESSPNLKNLVQTIKFLKTYLKEMKREIKENMNIICHG